jgi:hypothetical protein
MEQRIHTDPGILAKSSASFIQHAAGKVFEGFLKAGFGCFKVTGLIGEPAALEFQLGLKFCVTDLLCGKYGSIRHNPADSKEQENEQEQ